MSIFKSKKDRQIEELQNEIEKLLVENEKLQDENSDLIIDLAITEEDRGKYKQNVTKAKGICVEKVTKAKDIINAKNSEINDLKAQIKYLSSQVEDRDKQISSLSSQVEDRDKQISSLSSQVENRDKQIKDKVQEKETEAQENKQLHYELKSKDNEISYLLKMVNELQKEINALKDADIKIETLDTLQKEIDKLQSEILEGKDTKLTTNKMVAQYLHTLALQAGLEDKDECIRAMIAQIRAMTEQYTIVDDAEENAYQMLLQAFDKLKLIADKVRLRIKETEEANLSLQKQLQEKNDTINNLMNQTQCSYTLQNNLNLKEYTDLLAYYDSLSSKIDYIIAAENKDNQSNIPDQSTNDMSDQPTLPDQSTTSNQPTEEEKAKQAFQEKLKSIYKFI